MKRVLIVATTAFLVSFLASACESRTEPTESDPSKMDAAPEVEQRAETDGVDAVDSKDQVDGDDKALVRKAKELARIRKEIDASPEDIDDILEKAGLSEDELEDLLFEIAQDPAASAAFAAQK